MASSWRARTKHTPRWPSCSLQARGHTSHCTRPSSSACQYWVGTTVDETAITLVQPDLGADLPDADPPGLGPPAGGFALGAGGTDRVPLGVSGRDPLLAAQGDNRLAGDVRASDVSLLGVVREPVVVAVVG